MKKIYLSFLAISIAVGVNAQQHNALISKQGGNPASATRTMQRAVNDNAEKSLLLWSDDISTPANWVMTNTSAPTPYDWVISTNPNIQQQNVTTMPSSLQTFNSTSAANGFLFISSDAQPGNADGDGAIVCEATNATPIDLTGYPNVVLKFQHSYRWYQDTRGVRVSGNGGSTWTEYEITNATGYPNLQNSENPVYETINISTPAGNSNDVLIQFYYNDNDIWGWYWTVDDVEIHEQPADDVQLLSSWISGENNDFSEYGRNPVDQLDANWLVGGQVYNFGINDATNLSLDADFTLFSQNPTSALLMSDSTEILETNSAQTFTPQVYTGNYTLVSTEETGGIEFGNNVGMREFEVTPAETAPNSIYSLDGIGVYTTPTVVAIGTGNFTGSDDGLVLATRYHIKQTATVSGFRVMLDPATVAGGDIYGSFKDTATWWADDMTSFAACNPHTVTAGDVTAGYVDLWFPALVTLNPGAYYAAVELYSNAGSNDIFVMNDLTVAQPADASAIYISGDQSYTNGEAIGIRMLMGDTWGVGIDENSLAGVSIFPNPSEGVITVTNDNNTSNTIVINDMLGNEILTTTVDAESTIDLSANAAGVYIVKVSNENGTATKRVIIK